MRAERILQKADKCWVWEEGLEVSSSSACQGSLGKMQVPRSPYTLSDSWHVDKVSKWQGLGQLLAVLLLWVTDTRTLSAFCLVEITLLSLYQDWEAGQNTSCLQPRGWKRRKWERFPQWGPRDWLYVHGPYTSHSILKRAQNNPQLGSPSTILS